MDELFTRSRLKTILTQPIVSAGELIERVKSSVFSFIDVAPRYDDVTMLAVQRTDGGALGMIKPWGSAGIEPALYQPRPRPMACTPGDGEAMEGCSERTGR